MPHLDTLASRVVARRTALGLTQKELGIRCRRAKMTISRIERGVFLNPTMKTMEALSENLGVPVAELSSGKRRKNKGHGVRYTPRATQTKFRGDQK